MVWNTAHSWTERRVRAVQKHQEHPPFAGLSTGSTGASRSAAPGLLTVVSPLTLTPGDILQGLGLSDVTPGI